MKKIPVTNDAFAAIIKDDMERGCTAIIGQPKDRHVDSAAYTHEIFYEEFYCQAREEMLSSIVSLVKNKAVNCDTLIWRVVPEITYKNERNASFGYAKLYMRFAFVSNGSKVNIL